MNVSIDMAVVNKVYNYLINRPYVEVATLIDALVGEVEKSNSSVAKPVEGAKEQNV